MTEQERLTLWLHYGIERDTELFCRLLDEYPDLSELFSCVRKGDPAPEGVPEGVQKRLRQAAAPGFLDRYVGWLDKKGVRFLPITSEGYPVLLREIADPPSALFCRGNGSFPLTLPIAVVGSRLASDYGRQVAELFSRQLAERGAAIVTGLASGIDSAAAHGALKAADAACPVVGVLGCGIDVVYPPQNEKLFCEVLERGLIVTEFLPRTEPRAYHFPIRNRIVSGLSLGVLVVEAAERSGTSITAACALDQGREVFAVPGRITDLMSVGTNRMIRHGEAKPVFSVSDILCELTDLAEELPLNPDARVIPIGQLDPTERRVYTALLTGEKNADELAVLLAVPPAKLNSALTSLQFSGIMKQLPGRLYALDPVSAVVRQEE